MRSFRICTDDDNRILRRAGRALQLLNEDFSRRARDHVLVHRVSAFRIDCDIDLIDAPGAFAASGRRQVDLELGVAASRWW